MIHDWDNMLFRGGALATVGVALIHPPAALVFAGVAICLFAIVGAWIETRRKMRPSPSAVEDAN